MSIAELLIAAAAYDRLPVAMTYVNTKLFVDAAACERLPMAALHVSTFGSSVWQPGTASTHTDS